MPQPNRHSAAGETRIAPAALLDTVDAELATPYTQVVGP